MFMCVLLCVCAVAGLLVCGLVCAWACLVVCWYLCSHVFGLACLLGRALALACGCDVFVRLCMHVLVCMFLYRYVCACGRMCLWLCVRVLVCMFGCAYMCLRGCVCLGCSLVCVCALRGCLVVWMCGGVSVFRYGVL